MTPRRVLVGLRDAGPQVRSTHLLGVSPTTARVDPAYGRGGRVTTAGPVGKVVVQSPGRVLTLLEHTGYDYRLGVSQVAVQRRTD